MKGNRLIFGIIVLTFLIIVLSTLSLFNLEIKDEKNEIKNKSYNLGVIIKKDGLYDNFEIENKLNLLLNSIKNDINLDNVGIIKADITSLDELDLVVENLYYNKNVRYLIMVGRDLAWEGEDGWKKLKSDIESAFWYVNDELCYLNVREPDEQGKPSGSSEIRDIAISWVIAPDIYFEDKSLEEINKLKRNIVSNIITTYTEYHNNPQKIFDSFEKSCLYIRDNESIPSFYENSFDSGYQFDWILVMNTDFEKVWDEMKKGHLILEYVVHGTPYSLMISQSDSEFFTYIEDYNNFIEIYGLPVLFVSAGACDRNVIQRSCTNTGICFCWPQVNIYNGVWAYFTPGGNSADMENSFSKDKFIGESVLKNQCQIIIYGDITSHMT